MYKCKNWEIIFQQAKPKKITYVHMQSRICMVPLGSIPDPEHGSLARILGLKGQAEEIFNWCFSSIVQECSSSSLSSPSLPPSWVQ